APSSVIVSPLTVTRPSTMSVSATRRDATPAADRIFCSRTCASDPPPLRSALITGPVVRCLRLAGLLRVRATDAPVRLRAPRVVGAFAVRRCLRVIARLRRPGVLRVIAPAEIEGKCPLLIHRGGQVEAERLGHVLDLGEVRQVLQPELVEELARGAVHERAPDHLLAAD